MSWLFTYGDLMGQLLLRRYDAQPALLANYHRAFNHVSTLLWGTRDHPSPYLGLSPGGECWGVAFRVSWLERRSLLRRLEPQENAQEYRRMRVPIRVADGGTETALVWVSRPPHADGARWADAALTEAFLAAHGTTGRGVEYVRALVHALGLWDISDPLIEEHWRRMESWRPR